MKLKNRALLVNLSMSVWSPAKIDRPESLELRKRHNTARNMARVSKRLMESQNLKDVLFIKGQARNEHYRQTLPWKDGDLRIVPTSNYIPYKAAMDKYSADFDAAARKFIADFPRDAAAAATLLGSLHRPEDYPKPADIAARFSFRVQFYAMPDEQDFRLDLAENELRSLRTDAEKLVRESLKDSIRESWDRIAASVSRIEERLTGTGPDGKDKRFHDTLIKNAKELADTLPRLNITQDPALDKIAAEIQARLTKHTAAKLRTDKGARQETAQAAAEIRAAVETERQKIETLDALGAYRG